MNYWLTSHRPPYRDEPADRIEPGVWLREGREAAGAELAEHDLVFIYQPMSGRILLEKQADGSTRRRHCRKGRMGIIAVGRVDANIAPRGDPAPERYADGSKIWWRWRAPVTLLNRSGFVHRAAINPILEYPDNYNLRRLSLKKLTDSQFNQLLSLYRDSVPNEQRDAGSARHGYGESQAHLDLKQYVAANPSVVLGEPDVQLVQVERPFPTGDRADIVLRDRAGTIIGLEIEIDVLPSDLTGALQAIKYRRMLEMAAGVRHGDSRAILVAHTIAAEVRALCANYEVECFEVPITDVTRWRASVVGKPNLTATAST